MNGAWNQIQFRLVVAAILLSLSTLVDDKHVFFSFTIPSSAATINPHLNVFQVLISARNLDKLLDQLAQLDHLSLLKTL